MAVAILAVCSCDKTPKETPKEDSVSVSPQSKTFNAEGGTVDVTVTSSDEWLLDGNCDWVTPSTVSGVDGDVVTFTVEPNETYETLNTTYTFLVGEKTATFDITVAAHALPTFTLTSETSVNMTCAEGYFDVTLDTDVTANDISCTISDDATSWLKFYSVDGAKRTFKVSENPDYEVRTGTITLSADMCDDITVTVSQNAKSKIVLSAEKYECEAEAGTLEVTVSEANVEYEVVVPDEYKEWLSVQSVSDGTITLAVTAAEDSREGKVQVSAVDGTLTVEATVAQIAAAKGAKVTVVDGVDASWTLYEEGWWPKGINTYSNSYSNWNKEQYGSSVQRIFNKPSTESKICGYISEGFHIIIDMFEVTRIDGLRFRQHNNEIRMATSFKLYVSNDEDTWVELGEFGNGTTKENWYFAFENLECRYFKYEPTGEPSWGQYVYVFNLMFYHL